MADIASRVDKLMKNWGVGVWYRYDSDKLGVRDQLIRHIEKIEKERDFWHEKADERLDDSHTAYVRRELLDALASVQSDLGEREDKFEARIKELEDRAKKAEEKAEQYRLELTKIIKGGV